ncbi:MAG TPA: NAD(P)/FAD-dependent oxidoreductase [Steroidobacteraceae bacterium]|nr:NAD(P)/FAD-dependent oxidoreductase [Steroidobacteraceae bacterium]
MNSVEQRDVVIIGAGPSGSIAAALMKRRGWDVLVLEAQQFPRFVIGESLLTHCLDFIDEAGMLPAVRAAQFKHKNGAAFIRREEYGEVDFRDQFTPGHESTYQVPRAQFDKLLADEAEKQGAEIRYRTRVVAFDNSQSPVQVTSENAQGERAIIQAKFVFDASGFARVLPKLLDLEMPSDFPNRAAVFTHVLDKAPMDAFDRDKVQVIVHPKHKDVWYWIIPFADHRCSVGCAAAQEFFANYSSDPAIRIKQLFAEEPFMSRTFENAEWDSPVRSQAGYASNVKSMWGPGFALLGNAAEFLDPVFSSGITIAMKSASLAAAVLDRQLRGEVVDWKQDFEAPLRKGVDVFRTYVYAWYDGRFQDVMFSSTHAPGIRRMICSILAGYAWDESNPFVVDAERRLDMLAQVCRPASQPSSTH